MAEPATYQILVKLLDGRTSCIRFPSPTISGDSLRLAVSSVSGVPAYLLRLVSGRLEISDSTLLSASRAGAGGYFPSAAAVLRLRGGKGGFGSLLRGAGTKAGQKKTSNYDACRDMSGRRLRHVNAERRLEEWLDDAEGREFERLAEEFIRKKGKEAARSAGVKGADVEKYLEKFRKDAEFCVEEVEAAVRESLRKRRKASAPAAEGPESKKLKIWLGKKVMEESDSDDDEDDEDSDEDEGADMKSVVLDEGNCSNESEEGKEVNVVLGTAPRSHLEGESSGDVSRQSDSEGDNGNCVQEMSPEPPWSSASEDRHGNFESEGSAEPELGPQVASPEVAMPSSEKETVSSGTQMEVENNGCPELVHDKHEVSNVESIAEGDDVSNSEGPLDLGKYNSASELEVLGMDRLKVELQSHGLKCGGTLQERASRLFLLKTTPLEKLPKKVLARPVAGGK